MKIKKILCAVASALTASVLFISGIVSVPDMVSADAVSDMDEFVRNYENFCEVHIRTMDGEELYSHNADTPLFSASLIKLPYAVFVCQELSAGKRSLDDTFVYTSDWWHKGTGIIRHGEDGTEYTIRDLLDYMLRYSDNVAYDVLVYYFGTEGFNSMMKDWGYDVRLGTPSPRWPDITALYMYDSMKEMALHAKDGEAWKTAWDALRGSTDIVSRSVLSDGKNEVAAKYGQFQYVYHECSYVSGDVPYIFTVFTKASHGTYTDEDFIDADFVSKAAEFAENIVKEYKVTLPVYGDVNADGNVSSEDLVLLGKYLLMRESISFPEPETADVNRDGCINVLDHLHIMKMLIFKN